MTRLLSTVCLVLLVLMMCFGCTGTEKAGETNTQTEEEPSVSVEEPSGVNEEEKNEEASDEIESNETEEAEEPQLVTDFTAKSPVSTFSTQDISYLGVDCSGSDEEIAGCIRRWQEQNMVYASPDKGYNDAPDPMHWNYFLPGVWTSKDIIYEHTDNGKVYGICHDFAIIYCSIAEYYGLECRVMNTKSKPGDQAGGETHNGMLREEYDRNKSKLDDNGLEYSFAAVDSVAEGTPTHYWAEVKLNGEWVAQDGTQQATGGNTSTEFIATGDFEITDWLSRDKTELLESYSYAGITDDSGQSGRAANIDDLFKGLALAPYFDNAEDARDFIMAGDHVTASDLLEAMEDKEAYEDCSGKKLYLVCYFICDGDDLEGAAWAECYELYSGEKLDSECARDITEDF